MEYQLLTGYLIVKLDLFVNVWKYSFDYNQCSITFILNGTFFICLHIVIWYEVFLSNMNNLQEILWFQIASSFIVLHTPQSSGAGSSPPDAV